MKLTEEQRKQLLSYLVTKPYMEVQKLIQMLVTLPVIEDKNNKDGKQL